MLQNNVIYNITYSMASSFHEEWMGWLKNIYIPAMEASGCFYKTVVLKLRSDDAGSLTYAVQFYAAGEEDYQRFNNMHKSSIEQSRSNRWGEEVLFFTTVLEVVH